MSSSGLSMLAEFYDYLDSSIRLLRLKGLVSSFPNIKAKIECLSDGRKFSHGHLVQLKDIMPEVIEIKKVNLFDELSRCMMPELVISINVDAIEFDANLDSKLSKNFRLRKLFRSRLAELIEAEERDEIPEEAVSNV